MTRQTAQRAELALKAAFVVGCCLAIYLRLEIFVWLALWPLVGMATAVRGEWEERVGFAAFLATLALTRLIFGLQTPVPGVIVLDLLFLLVLLVIAVRSRRWWPSWAAAFQLAALAIRVMFFAPYPPIELFEYLVSITIWTWLVFIAISLGVWDRWRTRDSDIKPRGSAAAAIILMTSFAFWYVWPALPSRLAEIGLAR